MRTISAIAGAMIAILVACGFAAERGSRTGDKETSRQTSDWGPVENGLQLRVAAPQDVEQGMVLPVKLEFRQPPDKRQSGIARLNAFLHDEYIELLLTDPAQDKSWVVKPLDPTVGMPPPPDLNRSSVPLDGSQIKPWEAELPLVMLYNNLKPGTYTARVRFTFPQERTRFWRGTDAEWGDAGFWHGTLVSGPFRLNLKQETPKTKTLTVPKTLRFRREQVQLRADDKTKTLVPAVYFDKRDAETAEVPVRNGHWMGMWLYRDGDQTTLSGDLLRPDSPNALDAWYDYKGGDRKATYTIEVFETADPPQHHWSPSPASRGYKVLWKKTYRVSYSRQKL